MSTSLYFSHSLGEVSDRSPERKTLRSLGEVSDRSPGEKTMVIRELERDEIKRIWEDIDRSEVIENVYYLRDGELVLEEEHYDMRGWPPGELRQCTQILTDCFDRGGTFYGAFEGQKMMGAAILESKFIGKNEHQLQLKFLHVSSERRNRGLGRTLFEKAAAKAKELGAERLYVSATPSENTVNFYRHLGCTVTEEIDQELFDLEPEDIHMEYTIPQGDLQ